MAVSDIYMLQEYGKRAGGRIYGSKYGVAGLGQTDTTGGTGMGNWLMYAGLGLGAYFLYNKMKGGSGASSPAVVGGLGGVGGRRRRRGSRRATAGQAAARARFKSAAKACKGKPGYSKCVGRYLRGGKKARKSGRGRRRGR